MNKVLFIFTFLFLQKPKQNFYKKKDLDSFLDFSHTRKITQVPLIKIKENVSYKYNDFD
tara:strand:+ start:257 stop:433 length:177 start_codon:yes stop_codon:yes gene_type:complete